MASRLLSRAAKRAPARMVVFFGAGSRRGLAAAAGDGTRAGPTPLQRVRDLLHIRHAVLSAPMWLASGTRLGVEVTRAGGLGWLSSGYGDLKPWHKELDLWREVNAADLSAGGTGVRMGVGLCEWSVQQNPHVLEAVLSAAADPTLRVAALWLGFGDSTKTVAHIRARLGPQCPPLLHMAQSVEHALVAAAWGADAVVAQGNESGGHGAAHNLSTLTLVPAIRAALRDFNAARARPADAIPVIAAGGLATGADAAGGLATGADAAAMLALGAGGVAMGTRFCLTPESTLPSAVKERMRTAKGTDTVRSTVMDLIRFPWPHPFDARAIAEPVITAWHDRETELKGDALAAARKDFDARGGRFVWCGSGVDKCNHTLTPAAQIVRDVVAECNAITAGLATADGL